MIGTRYLFTIFAVILIGSAISAYAHRPEIQSVKLYPVYPKENAKILEKAKASLLIDEQVECGSEEMLHVGTFTIMDYSVVIGMLVISLGIGIFYGFFNKKSSDSPSDFLLGSEMSLFPVTLSLTTSFITAIELLGNPSEMFFNGTQFCLIVISMVVVIPVAIKFFYPLYMKHNVTSCYEYLGIRFGKDCRIFGAVLYILQMSFYTAVAVLAPAIALSKATGLNTYLAVGLIYVVCIFYSSQGGLKAVVIADTFQACVLALSLIVVLILGHFYSGDISEVFTTANEKGRLEFFNIDPNPTTRHTVWSVMIGGFFYWTSMFCTNQACVQKCMSLRSLSKIKMAIIFSVIGLIVVFMINFYTGLMVFNHYAKCDPFESGQIIAKDQLLPFYIMDVYNDISFLSGLFVAGIFAASLGTVASALSTLAAVTCEDILIGAFQVEICPKKMAGYAKWMSFGYGLISFGLVFIVEQLGGILQATLTLNGMIGGITLGLFSLGIFYKRANSRGTVFGGLLALIFVVFVGVMAQISNIEIPNLESSLESCDCYTNSTMEDIKQENDNNSSVSPLYRISYMWYSFLSAILTIIFGIIFSWFVDIYNSNRQDGDKPMTEKPVYRATDSERNNISIILDSEKEKEAISNLGKDNFAFEK